MLGKINNLYLILTKIPLIIFCSIIFLLLFINIPNGLLLGGDWTFPFNQESYEVWVKNRAWNSFNNFGENSVASLNGFYFKIFISFLKNIGIPFAYLQKITIILIFLIGHIGFVLLLERYLLVTKVYQKYLINLFGIFFIFTPIIFDYLVMGWIFVLLSAFLYPFFLLFLLKSIDEKNYKLNIFFASLVFSFSFMQVQAPIWYVVTTFIFLFDPQINKKKIIKNFTIILILSFLLNSHWIVPLMIDAEAKNIIIPSGLYNSSATLFVDDSFKLSNIFKFYGAVFNSHFETLYYWKLLHFDNVNFGFLINFLSLIPIFLILNLLFKNKNKFYSIIFFYIVGCALILIFININKNAFFDYYKFLVVIRQLSRFIIIFPFLIYFIITCMIIDQFENHNYKIEWNKIISIFLIVFNFSNLLPWVFNLKAKNDTVYYGKYFQLRNFDVQEDYKRLFKKLKKDQGKFTRSLYLPYGALILTDHSGLFYHMYASAVDIFSKTSPIPGAISTTERFSNSKIFIQNYLLNNEDLFNLSTGKHLSEKLTKNNLNNNYSDKNTNKCKSKKPKYHHFHDDYLLNQLYTVDLFIFRKDIISRNKIEYNDFKSFFDKSQNFQKYFESKNILENEKICKNSLIESSLLTFNSQSVSHNNFLSTFTKFDYQSIAKHKKKLKIKKYNDTLIFIAKNKSNNNALFLHESYSKNWCLVSDVDFEFNVIPIYQILKNVIFDGCHKYHAPALNYSNVWQNFDNKKNYALIYLPQFFFYLSISVYLIFFIIMIYFYIINLLKEKF